MLYEHCVNTLCPKHSFFLEKPTIYIYTRKAVSVFLRFKSSIIYMSQQAVPFIERKAVP